MNACFYFHIFKQTQIFLDYLYHLINKEQLLDKINFIFPDKIFNIDKKTPPPSNIQCFSVQKTTMEYNVFIYTKPTSY